jgi:hypothetical protein
MGIPNGTRCEFWVITTAGRHLLVDSWTVNDSRPGIWYYASTTVAMSRLRSVEVSRANGNVLVSVAASSQDSDRYNGGAGNAGDGSRA